MQMPLLALALAAGSALLSFFLSLRLTIALLVTGLIVAGTATSFVSSVAFETFLMVVAFGFPVIAGSTALGVAAGMQLRKKRRLAGILLLLPFPFFVCKTYYDAIKADKEFALAFDFVSRNSQLTQLVGGQVEVYSSMRTTYNDQRRGRYEYLLKGRPLFAIVDVIRTGDKPEFILACVTTLAPGQRHPPKDVCQESIVELPLLR